MRKYVPTCFSWSTIYNTAAVSIHFDRYFAAVERFRKTFLRIIHTNRRNVTVVVWKPLKIYITAIIDNGISNGNDYELSLTVKK